MSLSAPFPFRHAQIVLAIVAVGTAMRFAAGLGDLWLDEIWSLQLVQGVSSPVGILTELKHDNNHFLNSWLLYWLGGGQPDLVYRLPAIAAGAATLAAVCWITADRERLEQLVAIVLASTSYLLIHYGSEARGYSFAVLFALLAYQSLHRYLEQPGRRWAIAYAAASVLGLFSHLSFLYVFSAAILWSAFAQPADVAQRPAWLSRLLQLHTAPLLAAVVIYWLGIRDMELGGGPEYSVSGILAQTGSLLLGGPSVGGAAILVAAAAVALFCAGIVRSWRNRERGWPFAVLVVVLPVAYLLACRPHFMFVRYFLLATLFALLVVSREVAAWLRSGGWGRGAAIAFCLAFLLANATHFHQLGTAGRGQYCRALRHMAGEDGQQITIGGDHDHGMRKLIEFHARCLPNPAAVHYRDTDDWPARGVDWLLLHEPKNRLGGPRDLKNRYFVDGREYRRSRVFDASILSGWRWHCYHLVPRDKNAAVSQLSGRS